MGVEGSNLFARSKTSSPVTHCGTGGFAGATSTYRVVSPKFGRNYGEVGAALRARLFESRRFPVELRAGYDFRFTNGYVERNYRAGLAIEF